MENFYILANAKQKDALTKYLTDNEFWWETISASSTEVAIMVAMTKSDLVMLKLAVDTTRTI